MLITNLCSVLLPVDAGAPAPSRCSCWAPYKRPCRRRPTERSLEPVPCDAPASRERTIMARSKAEQKNSDLEPALESCLTCHPGTPLRRIRDPARLSACVFLGPGSSPGMTNQGITQVSERGDRMMMMMMMAACTSSLSASRALRSDAGLPGSSFDRPSRIYEYCDRGFSRMIAIGIINI